MQCRPIFIAQMLILEKSKINDLSIYPKGLERAKKTQSRRKKITKRESMIYKTENINKSKVGCLKIPMKLTNPYPD